MDRLIVDNLMHKFLDRNFLNRSQIMNEASIIWIIHFTRGRQNSPYNYYVQPFQLDILSCMELCHFHSQPENCAYFASIIVCAMMVVYACVCVNLKFCTLHVYTCSYRRQSVMHAAWSDIQLTLFHRQVENEWKKKLAALSGWKVGCKWDAMLRAMDRNRFKLFSKLQNCKCARYVRNRTA